MKLNKTIRLVFTVAALAFVGGSVIGTLALPILLAAYVSMYWLFLYAGYAMIVLYIILYFVRYWPSETNEKGRR